MFNYPVADKTTKEKNQRPEQNDHCVHAYNRFDYLITLKCFTAMSPNSPKADTVQERREVQC